MKSAGIVLNPLADGVHAVALVVVTRRFWLLDARARAVLAEPVSDPAVADALAAAGLLDRPGAPADAQSPHVQRLRPGLAHILQTPFDTSYPAAWPDPPADAFHPTHQP